jgi:chromosome partitioning protein
MTSIDRTNLQRVIAVINGKGGAGKTTITSNVGGLLAVSGWRVLIVDLDPQGGLGSDLGYLGAQNDDEGQALSKAMIYPDEVAVPVKDIRPNLDVLMGGRFLESASATLASHINQARATDPRLSVANLLSKIGGDYDIILIDCPPLNEVIQTAALAAARYALIPTKTDGSSINGLKITADRFDKVLDLNPDLDLLGVVLFGTGSSATSVRASATQKIVDSLGGEAARGLVFDAFVRHAESPAEKTRDVGLLVHELETEILKAPKWYVGLGKGKKVEAPGPISTIGLAGDMQAITAEVVKRISERETQEEATSV